jgi:hypothetical protein
LGLYDFSIEALDTNTIDLDYENPRIVGEPPKSEEDIVSYLFQFEGLKDLIENIASGGVNQAAELPYVMRNGDRYIVIEGNTRMTAYRLLSGSLKAPPRFAGLVPKVSEEIVNQCKKVRCAIADNRDQLRRLQAEAHFGRGAKSPWSYLATRQEIHRLWSGGKSIEELASIYSSKPAEIRSYLIQYDLYQKVLGLEWSKEELELLKAPELTFNPPVRFFDTIDHRKQVGVEFDMLSCTVKLIASDAADKLKHLIRKQLIEKHNSITATSKYPEIFADYVAPEKKDEEAAGSDQEDRNDTGNQPESGKGSDNGEENSSEEPGDDDQEASSRPKPFRLFEYTPIGTSAAWRQMMSEAKKLNCKNYPTAGAGLLRCIIEYLCIEIINREKLNPQGKDNTLEPAFNLVLSWRQLPRKQQRILKDFKDNGHINWLNLVLHGGTKVDPLKLMRVRDAIDEFVKANR